MNALGVAPKAIVIGGSIAGLFAGLHLRRVGWQVDVYERVGEPLHGRGAGIVTHQALFDSLAAVGIDPQDDLGVRVPGRVTFDQDGAVIGRMDCDQVLTSWGRVYEVLLAKFGQQHYHQGKSFERVEEVGDTVIAHFADASHVVGDLLIGADGFRSQVRTQFEPDCQPQYAGYVAWRGLVNESAFSEKTHNDMFMRFAFSLPRSEQMLGYPVAGDGNTMVPGKRRYNIVWYRPADSETGLPDLLTDIDGQMNGVSIAPNRIRADVLDKLHCEAQQLLAPQFAEAMRLCDQPFIQPIYDLTIQSMVHGRVVIIGDAAFVARPHVGMGVTKAAEDAQRLADCLADYAGAFNPQDNLAQFNRERHAVGSFVIQRARDLGAYMQAQIKTDDERAKAEAYRTPEMVMTQTATADFLAGLQTPSSLK